MFFAAGDEVAVAVPGLANIAVSGPSRDLFPVEAGGDEVGDRAVAGLGWGDRSGYLGSIGFGYPAGVCPSKCV
ncbi:MAG: hypothetical protein DLM64_05145, partial [Solirubrobacterales bacterium]